MAVTEPKSSSSEPPVGAEAPGGEKLTETSPPRVVSIALLAAIALFLLLAQSVFAYTPDDAFITYRYSHNLADGFGPVFNRHAPLADRTEGYSCPLYMALIAIVMKLPLGMDVLLRAKFLGLLCGILILVLIQRLARRVNLPVWAQAAAPVLLAALPSFVICSVNGMETIFMTALVTLGVTLFMSEQQQAPSGQKAGYASGLVFAACALSRPEGILFGIMAAGWLIVRRRGRLGRQGVRWLLAYAGPVVLFLLWRHAYYGLWVPNTYYAKRLPLEIAVPKGGAYLLRTFYIAIAGHPFFTALGVGWWLLALAGVASNRFLRAPHSIIPLMVAAQIIFVLQSGGDGMGGWRFMASVTPLIMLLSIGGIADIVEWMMSKTATRPVLLAHSVGGLMCLIVLAVCLSGFPGYWERSWSGYRSWASQGFTLDQRKMLRGWGMEMTPVISDWLNGHVPPGSTIAYTEMGVTPYLCPEINFLDAKGLTDHGVATLPDAAHQNDGVDDYYWSMRDAVGPYLRDIRKPDYVMYGASAPIVLIHNQPVAEKIEDNVPRNILDDAYHYDSAVVMPFATRGFRSYMVLWKRLSLHSISDLPQK